MFKKLISNLPFNPSLLGQVSFYAKRLKAEESIRRMGFGFMALAMFIQMFAVLAPPQKSLASSANNIINGLNTRQDILNAWDGKTGDSNVAEIYGKFGLKRSDIEALTNTPNDNIDSRLDYWSIGRHSLSADSRSAQIKQQYKNSEIPINTGSTTVYTRPLKAWDIKNPYNTYDAWQGTANGRDFWIIQDCGNFTTTGIPPITQPAPVVVAAPPVTTTAPVAPVQTTVVAAPEPVVTTAPPVSVVFVPVTLVTTLPNPKIELRKTIDGGVRTLKPGDQYTYRFEYRNSVINSVPAADVVLTDVLDTAHFDFVSMSTTAGVALINPSGTLTQQIGTVQYTAEYQLALTVTVKLKAGLTNGQSVCNTATLNSGNAGTATSGGSNLCIGVINPCPLDNNVASNTDPLCTNPVLVCALTQADVNRTSKESTLKTIVTSSNPTLTHVVSYAYNFGDSTSKTNNTTALTDTVKHVYKDGKYTASATVAYTVGSDTKTSHTVTCVADVETSPDQPLTLFKSAENITQKLNSVDTLIKKANASNIIEYTLTTHNSFAYDRTNYTVSDYVGDIMDYTIFSDADRIFLAEQGGSFDNKTNTITWVGQTVKANSDNTKKFRVTVKTPVPSTNKPNAMTTSFDCKITNKYGTEITIPINCPIAKTAETVSSTLPNTGTGTSLMIASTFMILIAYFFARSRLLGKEIELIRGEYATGGGF